MKITEKGDIFVTKPDLNLLEIRIYIILDDCTEKMKKNKDFPHVIIIFEGLFEQSMHICKLSEYNFEYMLSSMQKNV
jgi:hypothetical protein